MTTEERLAPAVAESWPALPLEEWRETLDTLHMWTQIVGKVKLGLSPFLNELWQVGLQVTTRGLTTGAIPTSGRSFAIDFDFVEHNLFIRSSDGLTKVLPLIPRPVADFYREFMASLDVLGIEVAINPLPAEVPNPIAFDRDVVHRSYDPTAVNRWWRILTQIDQVLQRYRAPFFGKSSPILFYWGSFDLSETRFSGRPAPLPAGSPRFVQLAEDQENACCGFWPGNTAMSGFTLGEPAFYAYAYPVPSAYANASVQPMEAYYHADLGEFVYPYAAARQAPSPEQAILTFFRSTYEAGANLAGWDRQALEREDLPEVQRSLATRDPAGGRDGRSR